MTSSQGLYVGQGRRLGRKTDNIRYHIEEGIDMNKEDILDFLTVTYGLLRFLRVLVRVSQMCHGNLSTSMHGYSFQTERCHGGRAKYLF